MPRQHGTIGFRSLVTFLAAATVAYAAWLTSIVSCAVNGMRPLLIASALFAPVGIIHGIGVWFSGW